MNRTHSIRLGLAALGLAVAFAGTSCKKKKEESGDKAAKAQEADKEEKKQEAKSPVAKAREKTDAFGQLPESFPSEDNPITEEKVNLGRKLYYETRLSKADDVSCNTCHLLDEYGVDHKPVSTGHKNRKGPRNAPTVYNAAGHIAQFWDGRAADVEEQAKGPVLNLKEMGIPENEVVEKRLNGIDGYKKEFAEAFPEADNPVSFDNMAKAIGAFERKLVTPAPWDEFLAGKDDAISTEAVKGFNTFTEVGCDTCHNGELLGGNMYQKLGLVEEWPNQEDQGRYEVTEKEADKMKFKVPSLRNITKTGPYFHSGDVEKLDEAVRMMAKHQLGKDLNDKQVDQIIAFLESLTGEIPTDYIEKPELPKAG